MEKNNLFDLGQGTRTHVFIYLSSITKTILNINYLLIETLCNVPCILCGTMKE